MLSHIHLRNFAIIEELNLELQPGMTALTGETGAGKSILIDAIGLVLGDRADSGVVRHGADRAEITLSVDVDDCHSAQQWLEAQALAGEDGLCILRRIISSSGKSRAWINGSPCNLGMLRQLGEMLVDIHGQHEHQSLMKKEMQRQLLDDYADNNTLLENVNEHFLAWKNLHNKLERLSNQHSDHQAKLDLLRFQTQELNDLQLQEHEVTQLDEEHSRLANAGQLIETAAHSVLQLYDADEQSLYASISSILQGLQSASKLDQTLLEPLEMLQNAQINIQEATNALRHYQETVEHDPDRLQQVNNRLSTLHELARKHQTSPDQLFNKWHDLQARLTELSSDEHDLDALQQKLEDSQSDYLKASKQLTRSRIKAAKKLSLSVSQAMQKLGMEGGQFLVALEENEHFSAHGMDDIEFQVSANPGQPPKPLVKVASGGELSRISLAIQMIAAQRITLPALIFDEVDSGIGGGIAEVVGQQLRNLGENRQVLCVTHLPQVASQAHNHYRVTKIKGKSSTATGMQVLDDHQRIEEIARMMGGIEITDSTRKLAKEMLGANS